MSDKYNVLINGASGFVGLELIKILSTHKSINLKYLCSRGSIGKSINSFLKNKIKKKLPLITDINKADFSDVDIIFSALPHGEAQLLSNNISPHHILIDLSADFRFLDIKGNFFLILFFKKELIDFPIDPLEHRYLRLMNL